MVILRFSLAFPQFTIIKTWIEYENEPLLCLAKAKGYEDKIVTYLFNAVSEEENIINYSVVWVSQERCDLLCSGKFGLRTAFTNPEFPMSIRIKSEYRPDTNKYFPHIKVNEPETFTDAELPLTDYYEE